MNILGCVSGTVQIEIYCYWFNYLSSVHFSETVEYGHEIDKLLEEHRPRWFIAVRVWPIEIKFNGNPTFSKIVNIPSDDRLPVRLKVIVENIYSIHYV